MGVHVPARAAFGSVLQVLIPSIPGTSRNACNPICWAALLTFINNVLQYWTWEACNQYSKCWWWSRYAVSFAVDKL